MKNILITILIQSIIIIGVILFINSKETRQHQVTKVDNPLFIELPEEIHLATDGDELIAVKRNDTIYIMYN